MDHRRRPSSPHVPPRDVPSGWVVAGEEQDGWVPPQRNGWEDGPPPDPDQPPQWYATPYDPGYGGQWYGEPAAPDYPPPEPGYPAPGYPAPGQGSLPPGPPAGSYPHPSGYPPDPPAATYPPPAAYPPPYPPSADPPPGYPPGRTARPRRAARRPGGQRPPAPEEPPPPAWTPALLWTVGAFLIPALVYLGWALTLSGAAPDGCVDAAGVACPPPRVAAVDRLTGTLPALGGALTLALLVAVGIRRIAADWRGMTVGLAAAVIGAGLATLVAAVLS